LISSQRINHNDIKWVRQCFGTCEFIAIMRLYNSNTHTRIYIYIHIYTHYYENVMYITLNQQKWFPDVFPQMKTIWRGRHCPAGVQKINHWSQKKGLPHATWLGMVQLHLKQTDYR
jgi:hypothetical protein